MFCQKCGSEVPNGLLVCQKCGAMVGAPNSVPMNNQMPNQMQNQMPNQVQVVNVKSHMCDSILCMIFCCLPFGIVGLVYACRVNALLKRGDIVGAQHASKMANMWNWIGVGCALLWCIIYGICIAAGIVSGF